MRDKEKALQEAGEAYEELREAVRGLDDDQSRAVWLGTWGAREILIHIAGWDRELAPAFSRIERGEPPYPAGAYDDYDAWNARFVEEGKHAAHHEILADLESTHRRFLAAAAAFTVACASKPTPITVTGDSAARASLAGKWVGEYTSPATGRSGSIVFNLSPTGDAASGDVVMVPREYGKALTPYATTTTGGVPIQNPGSASQVLTIKLVRVAGDTVSGVLDA